MHSTAMTVVATILVLLLGYALIGAATEFARQWVRSIVLKELDHVIGKAIRELKGDA